MSFNDIFRISELCVCKRGSAFSGLPPLSGNYLWKQQACSPSCTLGLQSPCSSTGCLLPSLLKNQVWSFVFRPTLERNAAAATVVTFHVRRNEQNLSKKKQGLCSQHCPHLLCHVQTQELYFGCLKNIELKQIQIL